jgi:hypothetical protein
MKKIYYKPIYTIIDFTSPIDCSKQSSISSASIGSYDSPQENKRVFDSTELNLVGLMLRISNEMWA